MKAKADVEEAIDDWEELFIAAIQGGTDGDDPRAFVDWCDEVATRAYYLIQKRRKDGLKA